VAKPRLRFYQLDIESGGPPEGQKGIKLKDYIDSENKKTGKKNWPVDTTSGNQPIKVRREDLRRHTPLRGDRRFCKCQAGHARPLHRGQRRGEARLAFVCRGFEIAGHLTSVLRRSLDRAPGNAGSSPASTMVDVWDRPSCDPLNDALRRGDRFYSGLCPARAGNDAFDPGENQAH
jgi:hypothetical protein